MNYTCRRAHTHEMPVSFCHQINSNARASESLAPSLSLELNQELDQTLTCNECEFFFFLVSVCVFSSTSLGPDASGRGQGRLEFGWFVILSSAASLLRFRFASCFPSLRVCFFVQLEIRDEFEWSLDSTFSLSLSLRRIERPSDARRARGGRFCFRSSGRLIGVEARARVLDFVSSWVQFAGWKSGRVSFCFIWLLLVLVMKPLEGAETSTSLRSIGLEIHDWSQSPRREGAPSLACRRILFCARSPARRLVSSATQSGSPTLKTNQLALVVVLLAYSHCLSDSQRSNDPTTTTTHFIATNEPQDG